MRSAIPRTAISLLVFSAVSVAFSWPLLLHLDRATVTRQVDVYGAIWLVQAVQAVSSSMLSPTAWPVGQDLWAGDSLLMLLVARVLHAWTWPVVFISAVTLAGPVLSAWAAERFAARILGAAFPWSLVAGLGYGFSGLVATTLLEGQVYALVAPWLPLLAGAWITALGPEARLRHGLLAGLFWALCLLTTAYLGVAASLLVVGIAASEARPGRTRIRPPLAAAAVALPVGGAYVALLRRALAGSSGDTLASTLAAPGQWGSSTLASLAAPYPGIDLFDHSMGPTLGWTCFLFALLAPVVLGRPGPWRGLLATSLVLLVASLGPQIGPVFRETWLLTWTIWDAPGLDGFRFPCRLLAVSMLGFATVAAAVLTRLARGRPWWVAPVFGLILVDIFGIGKVSARTGTTFVETPSAYRAVSSEGALLELLPRFGPRETDLDIYFRHLSGTFAGAHGRPVVHAWGSDVHGVNGARSGAPGARVGAALDLWIFAGRCPDRGDGTPCDVAGWLAGLGIGSVAVRPHLWLRQDRGLVAARLEEVLGPPVAESTDAGDWVRVHRVPGTIASAGEALAAWQAWSAP